MYVCYVTKLCNKEPQRKIQLSITEMPATYSSPMTYFDWSELSGHSQVDYSTMVWYGNLDSFEWIVFKSLHIAILLTTWV